MTAQAELHDIGDRARADLADLIDRQMRPLGSAAMELLDVRRGHAVLDVGCGAGETVVQLSDRVGGSGRVIGVDIAPRVLAVARRRADHLTQVRLLNGDAATVALPDRSMDWIFSRFGTMFFADPVAAFINLRRLLKPGGRIGFVCWRAVAENELDVFCVDAAGLPIGIDASPYSFENAAFIAETLRSAGFDDVAVRAHDARVSCGDAVETLKVVTRVGALGKVLREHPALLPDAEPRVLAALRTREVNGAVHLGAATWLVTAARR